MLCPLKKTFLLRCNIIVRHYNVKNVMFPCAVELISSEPGDEEKDREENNGLP